MFTVPTEEHDVKQFDVFDENKKVISPKLSVLPNVDFTLNAFGWPLTDIAALNGCKSLQEFEVIAARLREYTATNPDTSKLSVAEIIEQIQPQSFQTPSEVAQFARYYGRHLQEKVDSAVAEKLAKSAQVVHDVNASEAAKSVSPSQGVKVNTAI